MDLVSLRFGWNVGTGSLPPLFGVQRKVGSEVSKSLPFTGRMSVPPSKDRHLQIIKTRKTSHSTGPCALPSFDVKTPIVLGEV